MWDIVIVGCGLSGMVVARKFADLGKKVLIIERRNHIGGNLYDRIDHNGFLVQEYGPHCFFTNDPSIEPYIQRFADTEECFVECKTMINGKALSMPFNFETIDLLYNKEDAFKLKTILREYFKGKEIVAVTDLLYSKNPKIVEYGNFMYENEYKLYSAKQWGRNIEEISPEVFKRVPVYLSYKKEYQSHAYQFLPVGGFTKLAENMVNDDNIEIMLNYDALSNNRLIIEKGKAFMHINDQIYDGPILFTGELDALFNYKYGCLPYRSLEFIWKVFERNSYQDTAIVAYPQADKITRITEYKKLPNQMINGKTVISIEIPFEYDANSPVGNEPYYPIKNEENDLLYTKYYDLAKSIENLFFCGRLADYKYYNMDMVILRAWEIAEKMLQKITE